MVVSRIQKPQSIKYDEKRYGHKKHNEMQTVIK